MPKAFMATVFLITLLLLYHPPSITPLLGKHLKPPLLLHPSPSSPATSHTRSTQYAAITRNLLAEHRSFLAAQIDRDYTHIEHLQRDMLGVTFEATIVVTYSASYPVGFDLHPDQFEVSDADGRLILTLPRPQLLAAPAITLLHHTIPSSSFIINEREAVIALQQRLPEIASSHAMGIVSDPAVIALCEQTLRSFLTDLLQRFPGIESVPVIEIQYH